MTLNRFYEHRWDPSAKWSWKPEGHYHAASDKTFPSFPKAYFKYTEADPTETTMAIALFGSVAEWDDLTSRQDPQWQKVLSDLREETRRRIRSAYIMQLVADSKSGGREGLAAAKFLEDYGYNSQELDERKRKRRGLDKPKDTTPVAKDYDRLKKLHGEKLLQFKN